MRCRFAGSLVGGGFQEVAGAGRVLPGVGRAAEQQSTWPVFLPALTASGGSAANLLPGVHHSPSLVGAGDRLPRDPLTGWAAPSTFGIRAAPADSVAGNLCAAISASAGPEPDGVASPEASEAWSVDLFFSSRNGVGKWDHQE
jgi:hypothetical protein